MYFPCTSHTALGTKMKQVFGCNWIHVLKIRFKIRWSRQCLCAFFPLLQQVHCQRKIRGAPALCEWTGVGTCLYIPVLGYPSFIQDFGYIRNDAVIQGFTFTSFGTTLGSRSGFLVHWFASSWPIFDMVLVCFGHICGYWHGSSIVMFRVAPTYRSMITTEGVSWGVMSATDLRDPPANGLGRSKTSGAGRQENPYHWFMVILGLLIGFTRRSKCRNIKQQMWREQATAWRIWLPNAMLSQKMPVPLLCEKSTTEWFQSIFQWLMNLWITHALQSQLE